MKRLLSVLLIFVILVAVLTASVSLYVAVNGKTILLSQLEKNLGIKANISAIKFVFPSTLVAEGLEFSETLKIKKIVLVPSLTGILKGDIGLNSLALYEPQMTVTRNPGDTFDYGLPAIKPAQPEAVPGKPEPPAAGKKEKAKKPLRFYVNKLDIIDAHITFVDKALVAGVPFVIKCSPLNLNVFRPSLFHFFRMQFNGLGSLLGQDDKGIGRVVLGGWVDPVNLDMDAKLEVAGGRLAYFSPYYNKFVKKELESGDAGITLVARSRSNDMTADCHIEVTNVAFKKAQEAAGAEQPSYKDFSDLTVVAFDSLLGAEGKTSFDFSIRTKMSEPKFENIKFKGNFFKSRVEAVLSKPPQETIQDFKKIGEEFEAIGKQFKDIFKSK